MTNSDYIFIGKVAPCGFANNDASNLIFSLCLDINGECSLLDPKSPDIGANYIKFYDSILALRDLSKNAIEKIDLHRVWPPAVHQNITESSITGSNDPLHFIGGGKYPDWKAIRTELYQKIFSCDGSFKRLKIVHPESRMDKYNVSDPTNFYDDKNLPNYYNYKKSRSINKFMNTGRLETPGYRSLLDKIYKTANYYKKLSKAQFQSFSLRHESTKKFISNYTGATASKDMDLLNGIYKSYVDGDTIDIDEIIHNFNLIAADPILARLFGFIIDFQVNVKKEFLPRDAYPADLGVELQLKSATGLANWKNIIYVPPLTNDFILGGNEKYTLIPGDNTFSSGSVLYAKQNGEDKITLTSYDKLKSEENLTNDNVSVVIDGFTRGIICHHEELNKLIKPVRDWPVLMYADTLFQGLRAAVGVVNKNKIKWFSLTNRNLEASYKGTVFFKSDHADGCLQVDNPMNYLDDDGSIKTTIPTVIFEYSEGLVSLKSAFAKVNKQSKNDQQEVEQTNMDDGGLRKSKSRFGKHIGIFKFPFTELDQEAEYKFMYDIPQQLLDNGGPKLRFGNQYVVVLYYGFTNGWSMPLGSGPNSQQLSIVDYIEHRRDMYSSPIEFKQLENFKPVLLFHTKKVAEDTNDQTQPITEKDAQHELVIRSDDYGDDSTETSRHVLPERISLEHAFWFDLLSTDNMSDDESYLWKRKYNCEFHNSKEYNDFVSKPNPKDPSKKNKCSEGCSEWCGATTMEDYYTTEFITPNHLSHPDVEGFKVKLCWQKDFAEKIINVDTSESKIRFSGEKGIRPQSCRLTVKNGIKDINIRRNSDGDIETITVKQGAVIYCRLINTINNSRKAIWTGDPLELYEHENGDADYNIPRELKIVHAVKRPLMVPQIKILFSTSPFHQQVEHIEVWLKRPEYQHYHLDQNIIANRVTNNPSALPQNSTLAQFDLISHFERLDAYKKGGFLEDVTPTGALELWMRKEIFIDNPEQIVLNPSSAGYNQTTNHLPNMPIQSFQSDLNKFSLEYKISFTNDILDQLKDLKKVEWTDQSNPFLAVVSKLQLQFDTKTRIFEEREYYLKDISKFKGYFDNQKLQNDDKGTIEDKAEEYALPRLKDVMKNLDSDSPLRFKVLVLNNSQPKKPDIAYAITTIQESRENPKSKTTLSTQKGNIITIYLKRGRLSSGKDERIGIIVDAASIYNDFYKANNWITRVGSDILTDKHINRNQFLQFRDIIIPEQNLYQAEFDDTLGIYHFLPQFDIEKQLWKFEVELKIQTENERQLHNPFINFSLVHYQPFSINYNDKPASQDINDIRKDCRMSDVDNSTWCYILPERKLSVFFDKPGGSGDWGKIAVTIKFDFESLHHFKTIDGWLIRSNFVLTIEGTFDGLAWYSINSQLDNKNELSDWAFHHFLLSDSILSQEQNFANLDLRFKQASNPSYKVFDPETDKTVETNKLLGAKESLTFKKFRVRFFEVEWFTLETWDELIKRCPDMFVDDPINNEQLRVRYVEVVY